MSAARTHSNKTRGRGGGCPARGFAVMAILRVTCRGGIYAARCSRPGYYDISVKRHGTQLCVPYKPTRKFVVSHISRAGRAPPLRSTRRIHVAAKHPFGIGIFSKRARAAGAPYLLSIIYYFLSIISNPVPNSRDLCYHKHKPL